MKRLSRTCVLLLALAISVPACESGKDDTASDADADGWTVGEGDCDDADAAVHPAAVESCDGVDDDCDGLVDEADSVGCTVYHEDLDGDGYGTEASRCLCAPEGDYTATQAQGDCDDADAAVHPGAAESCNDVDDDCDGGTDEDFDLDGDGWSTCDGDCDDADPAVNPGEAEICDDGIDNDCDGGPGDCALAGEIDLATADAKIVGEEAYDYAGGPVVAGDLDGDGLEDVLVGASRQDAGGVDAGAAYLVHGPVSDELDLVYADAKLVGEADGDHAGSSLAAGDVNGDGVLDVLVAAPQDVVYSTYTGVVYLMLGPVSGEVDLASADGKILGENEGHHAACSLAAGDVDGDGRDDVLVGAYADDEAGEDSGAAYVVYGPISGETDLSAADAKLLGEAGGDWAGTSLAAGDVDGDGVDDVIVGAEWGNSAAGEDWVGTAYVVLGPVTGTVFLADADAKLAGEASGDDAGGMLAVGDIDGDGLDDVLVGASGEDSGGLNAGAAYVVHGPVSGEVSLASADAKLVGEATNDYVGGRIDIGDVDGDGVGDVLVGAWGDDTGGDYAGAAYLVHGPVAGTLDLGSADAKLLGEAEDDAAGSVAVGDVDGDGVDDVLVGASGQDAGEYAAGAVYLLLGRGL